MSGPYTEALDWIMEHAGSNNAGHLVRMIQSLYDKDGPGYSFSYCVSILGPSQKKLCLDMCADYVENGHTAELDSVVATINDRYAFVARQRRDEAREEDYEELAKLEVGEKRGASAPF